VDEMVEWELPVISGFVSAVVSAIVNLIFRWDEKRPKVKVVTSIGSWELRGSGKPEAIIFSAQNNGAEITIKNYGLRIKKYIIFEEEVPEVLGLGFLAYYLDNNKYSVKLETYESFPFKLSRNTSCSIGIYIDNIAKKLVKEGYHGKISLIGYFKNQNDKLYKSNIYRLDIDKFSPNNITNNH
jgi:hypothetical protein